MKSRLSLVCLVAVIGASFSCEQQRYEETKKFNQSSSLHHSTEAAGTHAAPADGHAKPAAAH